MAQTYDPDADAAEPTPNLSADEVIRRLPEVRLIEDNKLRALTIDALRYAPDYFWKEAASTSGKYHHPHARGECGLWIHTKMAIPMFMRLAPSWVAQGKLTEKERDMALSALLLHDMFKQGLPENRDPDNPDDCHTSGDHDVVAAEWFAEHTNLPEEVIGAVKAHNGPEEWGEGPAPQSDVEQIVHTCDMLASDPNNPVSVWKPTEEILDVAPDINRADL